MDLPTVSMGWALPCCMRKLIGISSIFATSLPTPGLRADFELTEAMQACEVFSEFLIGLIDSKNLLNLKEGKELFKCLGIKNGKLYFAEPHGIYGLVYKKLGADLKVVEEDSPRPSCCLLLSRGCCASRFFTWFWDIGIRG